MVILGGITVSNKNIFKPIAYTPRFAISHNISQKKIILGLVSNLSTSLYLSDNRKSVISESTSCIVFIFFKWRFEFLENKKSSRFDLIDANNKITY